VVRDITQEEKSVLLRKIMVLRVLLFLSLACIVILGVYALEEKGIVRLNFGQPSAVLPHAEEIERIIRPLRYSGIQMFTDKDAYLTLNFDEGKWVLHNVHRFDEKGELILNEGRYGTCGELAAYTADKISRIFDKDYRIDFLTASQSGYFLTPKASHIVLRITSIAKSRQVYILDPSFRRYGPFEEFDDYLFLKEMPRLDFMESKSSDVDQKFNMAVPLLIRKDYLLGFVVEDSNKEHGRENFTMALVLNRKYNYSGRYLFALRYFDGDTQIFENDKLALEILSRGEWDSLKDKVTWMFEQEISSLR